MKMVKSLLLGSAAGLVAVAGAQAADLPVKAKAVEYVKVCSLYGAGYYYIPGTDTCIKVGGYVRYEAYHNAVGAYVPFEGSTTQSVYNRHTDTFIHRARGVISADVRSQTEYGTLRSYMLFGINTTSAGQGGGGAIAPALAAHARAFIQFAGFTFGLTDSYYDFFNGAAYGFAPIFAGSAVGPAGILVAAYTAQFGNGVSASISLEDHQTRDKAVVDLSAGAAGALGTAALFPGFAASTTDTAGTRHPDIVGNIRVDQAWGSAQIMTALHQIRGGWYGNNSTGAGAGAAAFTAPGDTFGWAIGGGIMLNLPWSAGDRAYVEAGYTEGALSYVLLGGVNGGYGQAFNRFNGANVAAAWGFDSIFGTTAATGVVGHQLTRAWFIGGGIEHYWTPSLRSSIFANYTAIDYNGTATTLFCLSGASPMRTLGGAALATTAGCNPDFHVWNVGSRTIWNPAPMFDIGVEVMYTKLETSHDAALTRLFFAGAGGRAGPALYAPSSEGVWSSILRLQRNFWP